MSIYFEIFFCPPSVCSAQRAKILIISTTGRDWSWHRTLMRAFSSRGQKQTIYAPDEIQKSMFLPPLKMKSAPDE